MGCDRAGNRDYAKQYIDYSNFRLTSDDGSLSRPIGNLDASLNERSNKPTSKQSSTVQIRVANTRRTRRETGAFVRKVVRSEYELTHLLTRSNVWSRIYWQRGPKARTVVSPCGPQVERSPLIAFSHTLLLFLLLPTSACASPSSSSSLVVFPLLSFATRLLFSHLSPAPFPSLLSRRHPRLPLARFLPRPSRETSACTRMSRDFSQTLPFAPSSSCALALLFAFSLAR